MKKSTVRWRSLLVGEDWINLIFFQIHTLHLSHMLAGVFFRIHRILAQNCAHELSATRIGNATTNNPTVKHVVTWPCNEQDKRSNRDSYPADLRKRLWPTLLDLEGCKLNHSADAPNSAPFESVPETLMWEDWLLQHSWFRLLKASSGTFTSLTWQIIATSHAEATLYVMSLWQLPWIQPTYRTIILAMDMMTTSMGSAMVTKTPGIPIPSSATGAPEMSMPGMPGMDMGSSVNCKSSVRIVLCPRLSNTHLRNLHFIIDVLELVYPRRVLPIDDMAHNLKRHVCRLMHLRHRPCASSRILAPLAARIRPADPATRHVWLRGRSCFQYLQVRQEGQCRQQWHQQHGRSSSFGCSFTGGMGKIFTAESTWSCPKRAPASHSRGHLHAAVFRCVLDHALGHVLQRIHTRLRFHRSIYWLFHLLLGCIGRCKHVSILFSSRALCWPRLLWQVFRLRTPRAARELVDGVYMAENS